MGPLLVIPSLLNNRGFRQVQDLLPYIQFSQAISSFFQIPDSFQFFPVETVNIFNMPEPHIQDLLIVMIGHGCANSTTSIMTANDHMFYAQVDNGKFENAEQIDIGMYNEVRDIAVNKDLTWLSSRDLIGGNPAVAATYPKEFGTLQMGKLFKIFRVQPKLSGCPFLIVI